MELKKTPKADLQNKKGLLLEIGLVIALLAVILAFSWTPTEYRIEKMETAAVAVEEEITEITRQDQKPPEPPKKTEITVITDILDIVTNDTKITTDIDFAEFSEDVEAARQNTQQQDADEPFVKVEQMPSFQGGDLMTFRNWVQGKVKYPQFAQENGISGRVLLTFVVEKDGSVSNIQVLQAPDRSLSDEAVRVLQQSPRWTPGKQRGEAVRVKYTLPVDFRFQN